MHINVGKVECDSESAHGVHDWRLPDWQLVAWEKEKQSCGVLALEKSRKKDYEMTRQKVILVAHQKVEPIA